MTSTTGTLVQALLLCACAAPEEAPAVRPAPRGLARAGHVVVVSIDGLRPDAVTSAGMPVLHGKLAECVSSTGAQTVTPSLTLPAHTSLLSGLTPQQHGVDWNTLRPDKGRIAVPTIFDSLHAAGLRSALFAGKKKLWHLASPDAVEPISAADRPDDQVMDEALAHLAGEPARLVLIHLGDVDRAGHADGWTSQRQLRAHTRADRELQRLFASLAQRPDEETWAVLVTSDHGGTGFSHHRGSLLETTIPWIVCGDGVRPATLPPVSLTETATTIADILELTFEPSPPGPQIE